MKLPKTFYKLPFRFDVPQLRAETNHFTEADWTPHPQGYVGNSGLVLVSVDGEQNDTLAGPMRSCPGSLQWLTHQTLPWRWRECSGNSKPLGTRRRQFLTAARRLVLAP